MPPLLLMKQAAKHQLASGYLPPAVSPLPLKFSPKDLSKVEQVYLFPPPNVTGKLHMGHALTVTIQDAAIRFQRLLGKEVRWIYGTDHAGIATQTVVEKQLYKIKNPETKLPFTTRHDLGRERFVHEVQKWTSLHKGKIATQLQVLNASLDYDREYFTLDDFHSNVVTQSFCRLFDQGLLTRKLRMVNYCFPLQTCLSDLEVDSMSIEKVQDLVLPNGDVGLVGVADDVAYLVEGTPEEEIVVRTTRLETMFGDVAIAVHPTDERYRHLIGKMCIHPLLPHKRLPILADEILVNPALGTGAVKVTPFHDESDFNCALRHELELGQNLFDAEGKIHGLTRFQMRTALRKQLQDIKAYRGQVEFPTSLPICSRTGDVVERVLKYQWFLDGKSLAQEALKHDMTFSPPEAEVEYKQWLARCGDWCVSRQLWWGHRIPAFRVKGSGESNWVVCAQGMEEAKRILQSSQVEQDEDVLDTWFSSGLLPLSTSPNQPLQWMETGSDILFFWVARMVMLNCALKNGKGPFPHVHLHTLVRDSKGRKMSKSLGNVIDPLHVIQGISFSDLCNEAETGNLTPKEAAVALKEIKRQFPQGIPAYGSDSLRMALATYASSSHITFDLSSVQSARLFCNKLWQACRFYEFRQLDVFSSNNNEESMELANRWIQQRLKSAQHVCFSAYSDLNVELANRTVRNFIYEDVCDVYIECCKACEKGNSPLFSHVLHASLVLLNPLAPNVTQELFDHFFSEKTLEWIYPVETEFRWNEEQVNQEMTTCLDLVRALRALKQRFPHQHSFVIHDSHYLFPASVLALAQKLTRCESLVQNTTSRLLPTTNPSVEALSGENRGYVEGVSNIPASKVETEEDAMKHRAECERLFKRQLVIQKESASIERRLNSVEFRMKAPEAVQEKERKRLSELQTEFDVLETAKTQLAKNVTFP